MTQPLDHIELWTHDLAQVEGAFGWLLGRLGWHPVVDADWSVGRVWAHGSGVYIVLEESPAVRSREHDRLRPGLNHLALRASSRAELDKLRSEHADHGWTELFGEKYPHAGGQEHTALFLENAQGFEMEVVAAPADG
jgi:hypothetical protein